MNKSELEKIINKAFDNKQNINEKYKVILYPGSWIDFKIIIFSKWGGVVYESDNPEEGWDGTINNKKDAISGIYTYYIEVKNIYNEVYKYEGTISLIRWLNYEN